MTHASTGTGAGRSITTALVTAALRPQRSVCREPFVLKVAQRGYFESGGFTAQGDQLTVRPAFGRERSAPVARVAALVRTKTYARTTLWQVLFVDANNDVLLKDSALFYTDEGLAHFAQKIGVSSLQQTFDDPKALHRAYPGAVPGLLAAMSPSWKAQQWMLLIPVALAIVLLLAAVLAR